MSAPETFADPATSPSAVSDAWRDLNVSIATLVPVHNQLEATKRFLASYYASLTDSPLNGRCSLIIIDDGSTDGTSKWLSAHHPRTVVLNGDGNLWWSGSMNLALKHVLAGGFTHALLFNNDNTLDAGFFTNMEEVIHRTGANAIISSKVTHSHTVPSYQKIVGGPPSAAPTR